MASPSIRVILIDHNCHAHWEGSRRKHLSSLNAYLPRQNRSRGHADGQYVPFSQRLTSCETSCKRLSRHDWLFATKCIL